MIVGEGDEGPCLASETLVRRKAQVSESRVVGVG
jgi:hypothetical protein